MCAVFTLLLFCGLTTCATVYGQCVEGHVKLTGISTNIMAGRVEVCLNNEYGTICGDASSQYWEMKNAQVVCRQLGYSGALNSIKSDTLLPFASNSVKVHYRDVTCYGDEDNLLDCSLSETSTNDFCPHAYDAAITCRSTSEGFATVGDVRLIGNQEDGGAVEVFSDFGQWSTICYDSTWTDTAANIVCTQLGYEFGISAIVNSQSVTASNFPLRNFNCDSSAEKLTDCSLQAISTCSSGLHGGVECIRSTLEDGSIRLTDGTEGRVEILYNGRWGIICDDTFWSTSDGTVACVELGYGDDVVNTDVFTDYFGDTGLRPTWLGGLQCDGDEESLSDCAFVDAIGYSSVCSSTQPARLDCGPEPTSSSTSGLSGGAVTGIVFAVIFFFFFVVPFVWVLGKDKWRRREQYGLWRALTCPYRWCRSCSCSFSAFTRRQTRHTTTTTTTAETQSRTSSSSSSEADEPVTRPEVTNPEVEIPLEVLNAEQDENRELTNAPPPPYHASSNFPVADLTKPLPQPEELPPPYPGPPPPGAAYNPSKAVEAGISPYPATAPPEFGAGYPPAPGTGAPYPPLPGSVAAYPPPPGSGAAYPPPPGSGATYPPPPGVGFQGYPPPTNLPYPPGFTDLAYPPSLDPASVTQTGTGQDLPYPSAPPS